MTTADKSRKITCGRCGREVEMTPDRRITGRDRNGIARDFCCRRCLDEWKEETARCACCGRSMLGTGHYNPNNNHPQYCSEECREKAGWEKARKEGWVHTCMTCGKEFIRKKGGKYCNEKCRRKAGWKSKMTPRKTSGKQKESVIMRRETCAFCGKQYTREYRGELPDYRLVFCSEECEKKYRETARR